MKREDNAYLWFAMGVSLGAIVALQAAAIFSDRTCENWFYRYQTLIGAVATLFAAVLGVMAILRQIGVSREESEAKREETLKGARAMLPFAAHDLQLRVEETIEKITSILDKPPGLSDEVEEDGKIKRTKIFLSVT